MCRLFFWIAFFQPFSQKNLVLISVTVTVSEKPFFRDHLISKAVYQYLSSQHRILIQKHQICSSK